MAAPLKANIMPETRTSSTRPRAVTIISWFSIVYALFSVIPKVFLLIDPETYGIALELNDSVQDMGLVNVPFSFQVAHALIGVPVLLFSGIFMLKGRLWALVALLLWMVGVIVLTLFVSGFSTSLYAKLAVAGIVAFLLTRPLELAYFLSPGDDNEA